MVQILRIILENLWSLFILCRYGKIISTKAIIDQQTNKCKGEFCYSPI